MGTKPRLYPGRGEIRSALRWSVVHWVPCWGAGETSLRPAPIGHRTLGLPCPVGVDVGQEDRPDRAHLTMASTSVAASPAALTGLVITAAR